MKATPTTRFALAALALMASLPFLVPLHTTPIPSFHSEWLAGALGLAACAVLVVERGLPLPGAARLALLLAGVAIVQQVSGFAPVPQLATLFALYLVWAALLACTGRALAECFGAAHLCGVLAAAILAGSLLAALLGMAQPWLAPLGWTGYPLRSGGPVGQTNHLTVYLWLGLASALYLRVTRRLPGAGFWSAAAVLALAAVFVGQRSSFVYAVALFAVAAWRWRDDGRRLAFGVGLLFVVLQPLAVLLPLGESVAPPPAMRVAAQIDGPSARLQLLGLAGRAIADAPLAGAGIGGFPGLAYVHADAVAPADNPGPAEHAHNLFADIAAELGLPAALSVAGAALLWFRHLSGSAPRPEAGWAAAIVGMLGLHSMIEYPLWHTYFLGLIAVVAGAFGGRRRVGTRLSAVALTVGLIAYGSWTLLDLRRDYARLELALGSNDKAALLSISKDSLLTPWVQTTACVSLDPDRVVLDDGLAVCEAAMKFAPTPQTGKNLAALLRRNGRHTEADDLLRRTVRGSNKPG